MVLVWRIADDSPNFLLAKLSRYTVLLFCAPYFIWLSHDILLCHIIIEQFTSVEQHIGGLLAAVPPLVNACEEFLTISHDINNK